MQITKITSRIATVLILLFISDIAFELVGYFLQIGASDKIRTLMSANLPTNEFPQQVVINIDGYQAIYVKESDSYNHLLELFRLKYKEEVVMKAGPYPPIRTAVPAGDIAIHYFGLPYRFKMIRSPVNPNFLWVVLPDGNGRPGTAYPVLIDNDKLGGFVRATPQAEPAVTSTTK